MDATPSPFAWLDSSAITNPFGDRYSTERLDTQRLAGAVCKRHSDKRRRANKLAARANYVAYDAGRVGLSASMTEVA